MTASSEIDSAQEFINRIEAMINAPYWNSERREKIGDCARKARTHLQTAKACLTTELSIPTEASPSGS